MAPSCEDVEVELVFPGEMLVPMAIATTAKPAEVPQRDRVDTSGEYTCVRQYEREPVLEETLLMSCDLVR